MQFSTNSAIAFSGLLCDSAMMRIAFQSSPIRSLPPAMSLLPAKPPPVLSACAPVVARDDASHELVEQRNSECGVAMVRAPDHAFCDELIPRWTQRGHLPIQLVSDVS